MVAPVFFFVIIIFKLDIPLKSMGKVIIVLNPGSTSTKVGLFDIKNKNLAELAVRV